MAFAVQCDGPMMADSRLDALFEEMDRDGAVCVMELHGERELAYNADELMDTGSAFKIAIALEVCCQIAEGKLDPGRWIRVDAEKAPIGLGTVAQALELMMSLSDNAAANALLRLAGYERITRRLASLGLRRSTVCHDIPAALGISLDTVQAVARAGGYGDWFAIAGDGSGTGLRTDREVLPVGSCGPVTTARELAGLYAMIWTDRAGPTAGCALTRSVTHELRNRIAAGFTMQTARFAGKGGSFPGLIANDAGVLTFDEGHSYAIAVLSRARHAYAAEEHIDDRLAAVAAAAIARLRGSC